jgi:transposase-like protein
MGRKPKRTLPMQRRIVQQLLQGTQSCAALARKYRVSDQTLCRWQKRFLEDAGAFSSLVTPDHESPSVYSGPRKLDHDVESNAW